MRLWLRPGLLGLHVFAVVAIGFCVVMGLWQLGHYDSRQADARDNRQEGSPVELTQLWNPDQVFTNRLAGRAVRVTGRFSDQQIFVIGKTLDGEQGMWVVAPVQVEGTDASLLVVRGWAAELPRADRPEPAPAGNVEFEAVLQPGEGSGEPFDAGTATIGALSIPQLTNVLHEDLYSGYAIATSPHITNPWEPVEPPDPDVAWTVGLRNLGYAFQWWLFAAFVLFMWWRMASENVAARRAEAAAGSVTP